MYAQCATGAAGGIVDPAHNYFCGPDLPKGAISNGTRPLLVSTVTSCESRVELRASSSLLQSPPTTGAGMLCYASQWDCQNGTNACGLDYPCVFDEPLCATGQASTSGELFARSLRSAFPPLTGWRIRRRPLQATTGCAGSIFLQGDSPTALVSPTRPPQLKESHFLRDSLRGLRSHRLILLRHERSL